MKKTNSAVGLMVLAWSSLATAQTAAQTPAASPATETSDLGYIGGSMRIGLGYDEKTRLRGEMYKVLTESETSAILGEAWVSRNAGGLKLSYNFIPAARVRSIDPAVIKTFIAADRNTDGDAKATLGAGFEKSSFFGGIYGSAAITRRRQISNATTQNITTITGNDGRPFNQDITTLTQTRIWERPYDYGVGARIGRFWESALVRLSLGADYEWGRDSAKQTTFSLGVEKFFYNQPFSVAVNVEHYRKSGGFDPGTNDNRVMAMLRYEFGGPNFRPARDYKMVEVATTVQPARPATPAPAPAAPATPAITAQAAPVVAAAPRREKRLVKTTAAMSAEEFFQFDRSTLTPSARESLDKVIAQLKSTGFTGNLHVVGHTCDIGSDAYNQRLSERRANAVRAYLVQTGGIQVEAVVAEGKGESEPKYPNTAAERHKNRRVDLEFVTYEDKVEEVLVPAPAPAPAAPIPARVVVTPPPAPMAPVAAVEWRREVIDAEPAWLRRALRQSVPHKMTVDTYRQKETSSTSTTSDKRYINSPPVAQNDTYSIPFNSSATSLDVLANDSDPDGDPLTITAVTAPAHGTTTIAAGRVSYTPTTGYSGTDTFRYTVSDGKGASATATVSITIQAPTNRPPIAQNDAFTIVQSSTNNSLNVLANDSDPDGDTLTITAVATPQHGTATISANRIIYTPTAGYNGTDRFIYTISDGKGETAFATVTITIPAVVVNQPPVATKDSYTVDQNSSNNSLNVLANDTDPDGDALAITGVTAPAHGTAVVLNNRVSYTPTAGYIGVDTFTYSISDGKGGTASAAVTMTVQSAAVNRPPVAVNDAFTVAVSSSNNSFNVLANDTDPDGDTLSITGTTTPMHGTALVLNNRVLYTPTPGYTGTDTFNYTITDGRGLTATAAVTITVGTGVANQPPVARNDVFTVNQDSKSNSFDVLANDTDPDGDPLTLMSVTAPAHGTATVTGNRVIYTPTTGYNGPDTFTYTISDGKGGTGTASVSVSVLTANNPPIARDDAFLITQVITNLNVLANDSDPDGDSLTITAVTQPTIGNVTIAADKKTVTYTKPTTFNQATFTYTISDGRGGSATATVTLTDP